MRGNPVCALVVTSLLMIFVASARAEELGACCNKRSAACRLLTTTGCYLLSNEDENWHFQGVGTFCLGDGCLVSETTARAASPGGHKPTTTIWSNPTCSTVSPSICSSGCPATSPGTPQYPDPELRISLKILISDLFFGRGGPGLRGVPGIEVMAAPLTDTGAWGRFEPAGYGGPTCPSVV